MNWDELFSNCLTTVYFKKISSATVLQLIFQKEQLNSPYNLHMHHNNNKQKNVTYTKQQAKYQKRAKIFSRIRISHKQESTGRRTADIPKERQF